MDILTLLGLSLGLGIVYYVMSRGQIVELLFNLDAAILVFGGTFAAIIITYPWKIIRRVSTAGFRIFFPPRRENPALLLQNMTALAEITVRSGAVGLSTEVEKQKDAFLKKGLTMIIENYDERVIRDVLEGEIQLFRQKEIQVVNVFRSMGTYSPIFGLLGTLIGVVQVLKNLSDPKSLGASMAIAVTTTFYGIFGANFLFLPAAGKLQTHLDDLIKVRLLIV